MATTITDNKKALFDFFIEEKIEAGIVLKGWEVKSLRANRGNIKESYAILRKKEVYLIGAHFSPLANANIKDEDEVTRTRKLLLNRKEITKIINFIQQKGYTLIPLSLYWKSGNVKIQIGSAYPLKKRMTMEVKGRDLVAGIPKTLIISDEEIREALTETFGRIVEAVKIALERTPPELAADIVDKGVVVAGGGSLIKGLDILLKEATGLPITLAADPLSAVALGAGKVLAEPKLLRKVTI